MKVEMLIQDMATGTIHDVSEVTSSINFETQIAETPGKLEFKLIKTAEVIITEGSIVSFKVDNNPVFWGYIFKIKQNDSHLIDILAYDQLRYLKNKDTYVLDGLSCSSIFSKICQDKSLKYKVVDSSAYVLPPRINDNKTYAEMIQYALDKTLIDKNKWYFIRDNFGVIEHLDVETQRLSLVIGDESLLTSYEFERSIDSDTYNQVKLIYENKDMNKREVYIVKDSSTIKKWGLLQYFETVTDEMNDSQLRARAENLLSHYNAPQRTLKLDCIGNFKVKVGCSVVLMIKDIDESFYKKYVLVNRVTHTFNNNVHLMSLEVMI